MSPYNRDGAFLSFPAESAANSFSRLEKLQMVWYWLSVTVCVVHSNSLTPGPKMTSFLVFVLKCLIYS